MNNNNNKLKNIRFKRDNIALISGFSSLVLGKVGGIEAAKVGEDEEIKVGGVEGVTVVGEVDDGIVGVGKESEIDSVVFKGYQEGIEVVNRIIKELSLINQDGFVNEFNLMDGSTYPNLSRCINSILVNEEEDIKGLSSRELIDLSKWSSNLMVLEVYHTLTKVIKSILINLNNGDYNEDYNDLLSDYETLQKEVYNKLDPSIRIHLRKKGFTIIQNTYTGYDSEYQNKDFKYNKLLSLQLAVNTKTLLKIPCPLSDPVFEISTVDTLKGFVIPLEGISTKIDYKRIEDLVSKHIKEIRYINYKNNDESIAVLTKGLKGAIPFIESGGYLVFSFDRSAIQRWFKHGGLEKGYTLQGLVEKSNSLAKPEHEKELNRIYGLLEDIYNNSFNKRADMLGELKPITSLGFKDDIVEGVVISKDLKGDIVEGVVTSKDLKDSTIVKKVKRYTRTKRRSFSEDFVSVTRITNNYFIGHLTNADLSILNDFEKLKHQLDIVNGSFITLKKPLLMDGVNLIVRDTMLLAPGGKKSLAHLGGLYGKSNHKIDIGENIKDMEGFLQKDFKRFKEYALQDAVISLIHASYMEDFNYVLGEVGIPLTLSSLASTYIKNKWLGAGYKGYQISHEYLLGDSSKNQTPKGIFANGLVGLNLSLYIGNYKGGRNESFMYGVDTDTKWYDYDLISAYTTVMGMLGDPDYKRAKRLTMVEFYRLGKFDLLYSYTIIKGTFKFPKHVKYPSIPCFVDKDTTVYPTMGDCILTGAEYLLAKSQYCVIEIEDIFTIPFKKSKPSKDNELIIIEPYKPFYDCIKDLQTERRKHDKGTINNLLYKDMGNSIYGLTVRGLTNKMKFDIRTGEVVRMNSSALSNPIIASWTTAFVRSLLGELLHRVDELGGSVVSVTTDGFITNIRNLEGKIKESGVFSLLSEYRSIRLRLCNDPTALEVKKEGVGIISWSTRGQFGRDSGIAATTGFQRYGFSSLELEKMFLETMKSQEKSIVFIQKSLRSALDIYKKGGHVTPTFREQVFRMLFDNRRLIQKDPNFNGINKLLDSKPVDNKSICELHRYISKISKSNIYQKNTSSSTYKNSYKNYTDMVIRSFVRALLTNSLNLDIGKFKDYKQIVKFVNSYDKKHSITPNSISLLKRRVMRPKMIVKNEETIRFVEYVKLTFPKFDEDSFFKAKYKVGEGE